MVIKVTTHVGDDFGAGHKGVFHLRIYRKIHIALSVALLRIGKTIVDGALLVPFYNRKWLYCLGQDRKFGHVQGDLPCLGSEDIPSDTDKITDTQELFENGIVKLWSISCGDVISAYVDL